PDQLAQLLQQNPQLGSLVRQRLQQSGLTPDQIRGQLAAAGYPSTLLDSYLGAAPPGGGAPALDSQELAALQALGLLTPGPATESITVATGFMRARPHPLDAA